MPELKSTDRRRTPGDGNELDLSLVFLVVSTHARDVE
jgi:hypothetical protein